MKDQDLYLATGLALALGAGGALLLRPKKAKGKNKLGSTLRHMGEMADSISAVMGW